MADAKTYRAATLANWRAWARRAVERRDGARALRFLDSLPDGHPSLDGVTPDDRAQLRAQLQGA